MASRFGNLTAAFSNVKIRTMMILTLVVLGLIIIVGVLGLRRANNIPTGTQLSKASQLESVPGLSPTSPQYAQVQQQVNQQNYDAALTTQGTAVPTIVNQQSLLNGQNIGLDGQSGNNNGMDSNGLSQGDSNAANGMDGNQANGAAGTGMGAGAGTGSDTSASDAEIKALQAQQKAQLDDMQKKLDALSSQQQQQLLQQTQAGMQKEAQSILASWNSDSGNPTQAYVPGNAEKTAASTHTAASGASDAQSSEKSSSNTNQSANNANQPLIKAGSILFASLDTAVNSDEPGPVMATIVTGQYKGTKLIGSIQNNPAIPGSNGPEKLILSFSTMSVPYLPQSIDVTAVAIDPDTARTALASDVNHHYVERYGSLFASSFLEGYGQAVTQSGSTVTVSPFGGTNTQYSQLNPEEELIAGFGQIGQDWGQQLGQTFNRKNTITINAGISLGVLFLDDVSADADNAPQPMATTVTTQTSTATQAASSGSTALTPVLNPTQS